MQNITIHDAIKIIKYNSFLKHLKYYEVDTCVYPIINAKKIGMYYIVIKNHVQFNDIIFEVDVMKKTFYEVDFSETSNKIKEDKLTEFNVKINRNKGNE